MLTYPKSTMCVLRMSMHLSSGHVTLVPGKFNPPLIFPQLDLWRRADSRWALLQISSLFVFFLSGYYFFGHFCMFCIFRYMHYHCTIQLSSFRAASVF